MSQHRTTEGPIGERLGAAVERSILEPAIRWSDPFERLVVGLRFRSGQRTVSGAEVIGFSALTGDWHPQHCDPVWAAASPFGERIAQGMLVLSFAVGLVPLDPERVLALRRVSDVVFKRPVRLGDAISVAGEISALTPIDESSGLVDFRWAIRNQEDAMVARAKVQVLWRRDARQATERAGAELWDEAIFGGTARGDFIPVPL
ncbi:MAG: MaoC family dehydratase [Solirubrobacteraceae bacterium]